MNIVIPDKLHFTIAQTDRLTELGATTYDDVPTSEAELIERVKGAEIITANYVDITPAVIDAATQLKHIIVPAVGYEWVDAAYARSKGIGVSNCPSFNSQSVAELAIGLILAASRLLLQANSDLRSGGWGPREFIGSELGGKRLSLIGHGNIGKRIEALASAFAMDVEYADSKTTAADLDRLIGRADYLVICCPLTDQTRGMFDARRIELLPSSAYLINVARGAILDQSALLHALKSNGIRGAALDVFVGEPLSGQPDNEIVELANLENVTATPHIGASTLQADIRLGDQIIQNIDALVAGSPLNVVN